MSTLEKLILVAERLVTCDPALGDGPLGVIEHGAVALDQGTIVAVGTAADVQRSRLGWDVATTTLITPGLIDAHTHSAWIGSRHDEYAVRMAGGDYEAIAAAGGGILSSHRAVVAASRADIARALRLRLRRMAALGVTTVEVKSGYGLLGREERKQLEAIADARLSPDIPRIVPTFLALHAVPPGVQRAAYVAQVLETLQAVHAGSLATFVDAYIDRNAFSCDEASPVLTRARELGLEIRAHVGQFSDVGGAELAVRVGACAIDHAEHLSVESMAALAQAGVYVGLLPTASLTLRSPPPNIPGMRAAGLPFYVASDANPGTAPTESLPLAMAHAAIGYGLTPEEILLGVTSRAAASLKLQDRVGRLATALAADLVSWDLPHERCLVQPWGTPQTGFVMKDGILLNGRLPERERYGAAAIRSSRSQT